MKRGTYRAVCDLREEMAKVDDEREFLRAVRGAISDASERLIARLSDFQTRIRYAPVMSIIIRIRWNSQRKSQPSIPMLAHPQPHIPLPLAHTPLPRLIVQFINRRIPAQFDPSTAFQMIECGCGESEG